MNRMLKLSLAVIVLACTLTGCSVNPVTGATEFSLVSAEQEVAIGTNNYAQANNHREASIILILTYRFILVILVKNWLQSVIVQISPMNSCY